MTCKLWTSPSPFPSGLRRDCIGMGSTPVPENQGTTEQPEYTETRHDRARIPFRVFCVFRG